MGATTKQTIIGVPNTYQQASQIPSTKAHAAIMTFFEEMPFLRNSPMNGSPNVSVNISG